MLTYRVYCIGEPGEIIASHWVTAKSDEEAVAAVREEHPNSRCELWLGERLVAELQT
jgi:hypothetical protein